MKKKFEEALTKFEEFGLVTLALAFVFLVLVLYPLFMGVAFAFVGLVFNNIPYAHNAIVYTLKQFGLDFTNKLDYLGFFAGVLLAYLSILVGEFRR